MLIENWSFLSRTPTMTDTELTQPLIYEEPPNRIWWYMSLLLTLRMEHSVWDVIMLHKVRTQRFLKIGAACVFLLEFVVTLMACFCISDNLYKDKIRLEIKQYHSTQNMDVLEYIEID